MVAAQGDAVPENAWKVVGVVEENHDIFTITLAGSDPKFARRRAGQFASVSLMGADGWSEPHPFTLSCAPEDPTICLTIKREGKFTTAAGELKPGALVRCWGPLGVFCRDIDARPAIVMIAGGVGITPFLSVLRHFRHVGAINRVTLFWVNRTRSDCFRDDEIRAMAREVDLTVVHCLTREEEPGQHFDPKEPRILYEKGRLGGDILKKYGVAAGAACYVCGPLPMMESALRELIALGVDPAAVEQERFSWEVAKGGGKETKEPENREGGGVR